MSAVFRLSTTEEMAISAGLCTSLSPQVSRSLIRLLTRWTESYLAPSEAYYAEVMTGVWILCYGEFYSGWVK